VARVFQTYRELPGVAGLDALYAIEDATTERQASGGPTSSDR